MFKKQSFEDNIYMKLFNWAYLILVGNILWTFLNLPFFLASLFLSFVPGNYVIFWGSLIFMGPATMIVFACLDEFATLKDISPLKTFFRYLRRYFLKGLGYWLAFLAIFLVAGVDILFFYKTSMAGIMLPLFILLTLLSLAIVLNCFYFQIRNPQSPVKDILRISFYYSLKKWYASLLNVALIGAMLTLMLLKPQFGFILSPVIFLGIIYLNSTKLHPEKK